MKRTRPRLEIAATSAPPIAPPGKRLLSSRCTAHAPSELTSAAARALGPFIARGLGFDVTEALRARRLRLVVLHTLDGRPLPSDWAVPVLRDEVVVVCAPLEQPLVGIAALILDRAHLPSPVLDDAARDRIAEALVDALLAEVHHARR